MFGYIVVNEPELRVREASLYRSYYCGLCEDLRALYGRSAQLVLNYDTTFLALLLSSLYEPEDEERSESACLVHPLKKHPLRRNRYTRYAAAMTVLLSFYSCRDDWEDEKRSSRLIMSGLLHGAFQKARHFHPAKAQAVRLWLERLQDLEKRGSDAVTPDEAGGCFGMLMAELFAPHCDEWEGALRQMGFYLGKFIYLLDAYDDLEKDEKKGCFNPLLPVRARLEGVSLHEGASSVSKKNMAPPPGKPSFPKNDTNRSTEDPSSATTDKISSPDSSSPAAPVPEDGHAQHPFDDHVRALLNMLMGSCCRAFEILPIVENADILRNILYAGVWTRFEAVYAARTKADDGGTRL